jgi:SMP-30/Gluconolactonase/LRE-like region
MTAVPHRRIVAYDVRSGSLGEQRPFIDCGDGIPDGLRIDEDGNLWCGWGGGEGLGGVRVFAPDSTPIGHIDLPERCANLAFGGRARNRLFLAAHSSLYALRQPPRRPLATRSGPRMPEAPADALTPARRDLELFRTVGAELSDVAIADVGSQR